MRDVIQRTFSSTQSPAANDLAQGVDTGAQPVTDAADLDGSMIPDTTEHWMMKLSWTAQRR